MHGHRTAGPHTHRAATEDGAEAKDEDKVSSRLVGLGEALADVLL
jgi:hypothetical protein